MKGSDAAAVRKRVESMPSRSFVSVRDLELPVEGRRMSKRAVEVELSRLAKAGIVRGVRKGLYWKGVETPSGMLPPTSTELGLAVGGPGTGPADVSAARFLGLTTQVPVVVDMAVPGRAPSPTADVVFHARPYSRATSRLRPAEVAVLEVLRIWPSGVEEDWEFLAERVTALCGMGTIRPECVSEAADQEHAPVVRDLWRELEQLVTAS